MRACMCTCGRATVRVCVCVCHHRDVQRQGRYSASVKAAAEGLGRQAVAQDCRWALSLRMRVNFSAVVGGARKIGLGQLRLLRVKFVWVQESANAGRGTVANMKSLANPADVLAKPQSAVEMSPLM